MLCLQLHHMMCFLALICALTRLASYIVTANVPALHLALHHDQDLLYCGAEDSDVWRPRYIVAQHI